VHSSLVLPHHGCHQARLECCWRCCRVHLVLCLQVQLLAKAALLLATAPNSGQRDRVMRYLPLWAPGTGKSGGGGCMNEAAITTTPAIILGDVLEGVKLTAGLRHGMLLAVQQCSRG
jgi:hypothetical protein